MADIEPHGGLAQTPVALDNVRTLIYFLGLIMDAKLTELRRTTPYASVRPSDIRVFVAAINLKQPTISEIARTLHISRQSVHKSVQRIVKLGVVALEQVPGNGRDKVVVVTQRGWLANSTAKNQVSNVESQLSASIGAEKYAEFRTSLAALVSEHIESLYRSSQDSGA